MPDDRTKNGPKREPQPNALAPLAMPQMDLVGPTVNDDIRRAIWRYGAEAVKNAVKEETKAKRGRKQERDWPELREVIQSDARDWLQGIDPFAARSNYAIAKDFAERRPGHNTISTHKRIERKLSKRPYDRRWFTLVTAENLSRDAFPYAAHLRALEALTDLPEGMTAQVWQTWLDRARATLADYEAREGEAPPAEMTFREVEEKVKSRSVAALSSRPRRHGLLGSILSEAVERAKD